VKGVTQCYVALRSGIYPPYHKLNQKKLNLKREL
jgi:hypothetical protein